VPPFEKGGRKLSKRLRRDSGDACAFVNFGEVLPKFIITYLFSFFKKKSKKYMQNEVFMV